MMRSALLRVTGNPVVRRAASGGLGRRVSLRFVAGEELDDALAVMRSLREGGLMTSLDHLGEHVTDLAAAQAAADAYTAALDRLEATGDANIAVKLSQLGLDVDREAAVKNAARVVERAAASGATVTFDMEDHRFTERTVEICLEMQERHPGAVGLALQSYLYRTPADLERVLGVQVRLCKGAYLEPPSVALASKEDVDGAYAFLARRLLEAGAYPMIATHDARLVRFVQHTAERLGRDRSTFEFQMLYGIRRDLQQRLASEGYRVRVYVPYGTEWYPYLVRRMAERPANMKFFVTQLFRG